ncbi:hypothetical protein G9A89_019373 [Geosiphon pyriformis]|nr:hypothetical protein G9A89_019373 [Geosiphon pyriformis]
MEEAESPEPAQFLEKISVYTDGLVKNLGLRPIFDGDMDDATNEPGCLNGIPM